MPCIVLNVLSWPDGPIRAQVVYSGSFETRATARASGTTLIDDIDTIRPSKTGAVEPIPHDRE
jgi:hypothetical protein